MLASLLKGILETLGRGGWQKLLCICICELFSVYRCVAVGHSECPSIAAGVDFTRSGEVTNYCIVSEQLNSPTSAK